MLQPRIYLRFTALVLAVYSLVLLFATEWVLQLARIEVSSSALMALRLLGASMIGHAYLNWSITKSALPAVIQVLHMNAIVLAFAVAIGLHNLLANPPVTNQNLILLMHAIFLTGFLVAIGGSRTKRSDN